MSSHPVLTENSSDHEINVVVPEFFLAEFPPSLHANGWARDDTPRDIAAEMPAIRGYA